MKRVKRRLGRGCLVLGALGLLGVLGGILYVRSQGGGLEAQIVRAKAHNLVLDVDAFTDVSKIPSAENAAAEYLAAGKTMAAMGSAASRWPGGYFTVDAASADKRRRDLQRFGKVFKQLEAASARPRCRFRWPGVEGAEVEFARFAQLKQFAKLLCARAALEAFEGRWDQAGASLSAAARIARHAGDEPTIIVMLVRVGIEGMIFRTARQALGQPKYDPHAQKPMREALAALGELPDPSVYLRGEVCFLFNPERGLLGEQGELIPNWVPRVAQGMALRAYKARLLLRFNDLFDRLGKPPVDPAALQPAMRQITKEIGGSLHPSDAAVDIMFSVYEQAGDLLLTLSARRRVVSEALAVLSFRDRTGHWPKDLRAAGEPLADPFDRKPLRYIPRTGGFVVYSIGKDRKDDGGGKNDEVFVFPAK